MKRPLLVFAGQSNMMGASVYPASEQIYFSNSYEYLHKAKRMGEPTGSFKAYGFPSGEFSYKDMTAAYGGRCAACAKSSLANYNETTYFCPSMCNLKSDEDKSEYPFSHFSEATAGMGVNLAPYIVKGLEEAGYACAYAHIAKGGVPIRHYLEGDSADYFDQKVLDFFADSTAKFSDDDTSDRVLFWLQGEGDGGASYDCYKSSLSKLWERAQGLGFNKLFIIRVGFWGNEGIAGIMRAQEDFCRETEDAFMLTRVCSFFEFKGQNPEGWFSENVPAEFSLCRDSFYGFNNQHINEKGFKVIAKYATPNLIRVLYEGKEPVLEEERVLKLR